jgi:hypothetical protein
MSFSSNFEGGLDEIALFITMSEPRARAATKGFLCLLTAFFTRVASEGFMGGFEGSETSAGVSKEGSAMSSSVAPYEREKASPNKKAHVVIVLFFVRNILDAAFTKKIIVCLITKQIALNYYR